MIKLISIAMLITVFLILVFDVPVSLYNQRDGEDKQIKRIKRTVGGSKAPTGAFPYQISLRTATDDRHFCSGSILRPTVILTAAHCVKRKSQIDLMVVAGTNHLSSGGTRHNVIIILPHEDFNQFNLKNDIALLILYPPVFYSDAIKPIELDSSFIGHGADVTLSGWGKNSFNGNNPDTLHFLNLTTIEILECKRRSRHKDGIDESTICTLTKVGEGACLSDSGGPLVADGKQIGIVSWGEQCAVGYPDIYTRVDTFIPWINKNIDLYALVKFKC